MTSPTVIRSNFSDIMATVRAQLVNFEVATDDNIHEIAQDQEPPSPTSDYDLVLRIGAPRPDPDHQPLGRFDRRVQRTIQVTIRTRANVDPAYEDQQWLRGSDDSHLAREERVIDGLDNFFPTDDTGNCLVVDSFHWQPSTMPKVDRKDGWGYSTMEFAVIYELSLTLNLEPGQYGPQATPYG